MNCDPGSLVNAARCFTRCVPDLVTLKTYLLCRLAAAGGVTPVVPTPGELVANDWATRVVANGGAFPSQASINGYTAFVDGCIADGNWSKMIHVNGMASDSLIAMKTPLLNIQGIDPWTPQAGNLEGATITLTADGLFVGPGASSCYNTGFNPSLAYVNDNSAGMTIILQPTGNLHAAEYVCGYNKSDTATLVFCIYANKAGGGQAGGSCWDQFNGGLFPAVGTWPAVKGYLSFNRTAANNLAIYGADSLNPHAQLGSTALLSAAVRSNQPVPIQGTFIVQLATYFPTNNTYGFAFFAGHLGLTLAESALLYPRIKTLFTAFGRVNT